MKTFKHLLTVVLITGIVLVISCFLYNIVMDNEEEQCWQELSSTAKSVEKEIVTKMKDEIVKLHLIETIMVQNDYFEVSEIDNLHISTVQLTTIFERIDVLYPDDTLISGGRRIESPPSISFEDIVQKGEYITHRKTDFATGKECVYYVLPVEKNHEIHAILVGVITSDNLKNVFQPTIYNGKANISLIDMRDGNYIMDTWHDELVNAFELDERKKVKGYENISLGEEIENGNSGSIAFESRSTGKIMYMYYLPIEEYDWQLAIFATEDVFFKDLESVRRQFWIMGVFEIILLILYFLWNIRTVRLLEKSHAEVMRRKNMFKYISYRDMLTSMYNRNKYIEVLESMKRRELDKVGVAYLDLNGLKQINDSQSHQKGDECIRSVARNILEVFPENSYRTGGDEFVILVENVEEEEFKYKMISLRKKMECESISISLGYLWEEHCVDLGSLLQEAEKRMYREKNYYYLISNTGR